VDNSSADLLHIRATRDITFGLNIRALKNFKARVETAIATESQVGAYISLPYIVAA
jgi:hypothetical protein